MIVSTLARTFKLASIAAAAAVVGGALIGASDASAQSARVKNACSGDYHRFCPSYAVGSSQLRSCMRSAGKRLSHQCLEALVDEGEIDRSALRKRR